MKTRFFLFACTLIGLLVGATIHFAGNPPGGNPLSAVSEWGGNFGSSLRNIPNKVYRANSYASGITRVAPSVVSIYTSETIYRSPSNNGSAINPNSIAPPERRQTNQGSGVLISSDGFVLTSNHLIEDADDIFISLSDGRLFPARKVGADRETDLAVVQAESDQDLPWCNLEHQADLQIGDIVLAIGNPYGVGQTVTQGIVSALERQITGVSSLQNFVQIDAAINPGNSGGALINPDGELVGINTAVYSRVNGAEGIGFAIPATLIREVVPQILEHGRVIRGWLGIGAEDLGSRRSQFGSSANGAIITGLFEGSPADFAGLRRGDIILSVDGDSIQSSGQLLTHIARRSPSSEVTLEGTRDDQRFSVSVMLSERPRFKTTPVQ